MPNAKSDLSKIQSLSWNPPIPNHISSLVPYPPGKPIEEAEREFGITGMVKLASNENPWGASPLGMSALKAELESSHRYPDAAHYKLKNRLSQMYEFPTNAFTVGNGSNELIDLLIRCFTQPGDNVVSHVAAFVAYKLCAQLQGCEFREAPLVETDCGLTTSVEELLKKVDQKTRLVFLANPNNPTGGFLTSDEIHHLAKELGKKQVLFVLDSAYCEYVTDPRIPNPHELAKQYPHLVVLKTFSKIYGLAGLRVGYSLSAEAVALGLAKSRQPFNVSSLGLAAACASLDDDEFVAMSKMENQKSLKQLKDGLKVFDVQIFESQGNFLLFDARQPSALLHHEFMKKGVILRPVANYGLTSHFRVTAGLPAENEKFLLAASQLLKPAKMR